jgi:type IV pilus assembly protein PilA
MLCSKCGNTIGENSQFCDRCGESVPNAQTATAPIVPGAALPSETSGKAIGSLVSGICGLLIFPAAIAAIVLGHISRSEIRKSAGRLKGAGLALGGLIMGYLGLSVIPVLIIAAIAIPNLLRARIAANEASAVSGVRILNVAEVTYQANFPQIGYTCSLPSLGGSNQSSTSAEHAHLIDDELSAGSRHGYRFVIQNCSSSNGVTVKYQVVAYPETHNQSGVRAFCSDETGVIKVEESGSREACLENGTVLE